MSGAEWREAADLVLCTGCFLAACIDFWYYMDTSRATYWLVGAVYFKVKRT